MLYLLVKDQNLYYPKLLSMSMVDINYDKLSFHDYLERFLKTYTFAMPMFDQSYIPNLVRKL